MLDELPTALSCTCPPPEFPPRPTIPELPEVVHLLTRRLKALDLGCGDGANALVLAELGFSTTAVDAAPHTIRELQRVATARHLPLRAICAAPHTFPMRGVYDVIVAHGCFGPLDPDQRFALIRQIQRSTRRGGFNVIIALTEVVEAPELQAAPPDGGSARIVDLYEQWKVLVHQSYTSRGAPWRDRGRARNTDKLIARRP